MDYYNYFFIAVFLCFVVLFLVAGYRMYKINESELSMDEEHQVSKIEDIKKELLDINTADLYKLYLEMEFGTKLRSIMFSELRNRGYWDEQESKDEQKSMDIYNKYKANK